MFESVLTAEIRKTIDMLSRWPFLNNFYLTGGTAAALQLGHRISHDLDFFSGAEFRHQDVNQSLRALGNFIIDYTDSNTLVGRLNEAKIGFFHYPYSLIKPTQSFRGLNIASLEDIGCSKIDTISARGKKRDFVDLYFILKELRINLKEIMKLFEKKFGQRQYNLVHIQKSLVFFEEAEQDPDLNMLVEFSWEECKAFFIKEIKEFLK